MELAILALIWVLYFFVHSFLVDTQVKGFFERNLPAITPYYRLLYNLLAGGGFILIWLYQRNLPVNRLFDELIPSYVGLSLVLIGGTLGAIALKNYSLSEFSGMAYLDRKKEPLLGRLQTTGLNAWVRHPLYFATLLIFWGWFGWKQTDLSLLIAVMVSIYLVIGSKLEEKKLLQTFGEAYKNYQNKVRMLIPFLF